MQYDTNIGMKHIILSDHVADLLKERQNKRQQRYEGQFHAYTKRCKEIDAIYQKELDQYKSRLGSMRNDLTIGKRRLQDGWQNKDWITIFYCLWMVIFHYISITVKEIGMGKPKKAFYPEEPLKEGEDDDDDILNSGRIGEQKTIDKVKAHLSDSWTLVTGCLTRKGEIDAVLVGLRGIFAIEIKNIKGDISCHGDRWTKDKYDNYGNLVECDVQLDKGKRNPSVQINDAANDLERHIRNKYPSCLINRIVVFTHEKTRIKERSNLTIDDVVILDEWDIRQTFIKGKVQLTADNVDKIVRLVEAYHKRCLPTKPNK